MEIQGQQQIRESQIVGEGCRTGMGSGGCRISLSLQWGGLLGAGAQHKLLTSCLGRAECCQLPAEAASG